MAESNQHNKQKKEKKVFKNKSSGILKILTNKFVFSGCFAILVFYYHCKISKPLWSAETINQTFFGEKIAIPNLLLHIQGSYYLVSLIALFFLFMLIYGVFFELYLFEEEQEEVEAEDVIIPPFPYDNQKMQMILGLKHNKFDLDLVANPSWLVVEEKGMFQNFLVSGSIGSGKTAFTLYPMLKQAMFYQATDKWEKAGMLVLDVKGNFCDNVIKFAEECGRKNDVILLELGGEYTYNPLHKPRMEVIDIAERVRTVLDLFSGGAKKEAFWDTKSGQMMAESIRLLRMTNDYVTLADVHKVVTDNEFLGNLLQQLQGMSENEVSNFDRETCLRYFHSEFSNKGAEKTIETIKACVTEMTGFFVSSENINNTFCPKKENLNFEGFQEVINLGKIVVLKMNVAMYPKVAKTISAFLKLDFFAEVQKRTAGLGLDNHRPVFFVCDEYQEFVTANDGNFYGVSREAKCCSIVASQSYTSLLKTLGDAKAFDTLAQNILNKIWLRTDDKATIDTAQLLTGQEIKLQYSRNISESANDSKRSALLNTLTTDKASVSESISVSTKKDFVFETKIFTQTLALGKAIVFTSTGEQMNEPYLVHLMPYYEGYVADEILPPQNVVGKTLALLGDKEKEKIQKQQIEKHNSQMLDKISGISKGLKKVDDIMQPVANRRAEGEFDEYEEIDESGQMYYEEDME